MGDADEKLDTTRESAQCRTTAKMKRLKLWNCSMS